MARFDFGGMEQGMAPAPPLPRFAVFAWLRFVVLFCLVFFPVYGFGQWYGARVQNHALYAAFEVHMPFIPWMILPYLSLFPAFAVPLFLLDADGVRLLTRQALVLLGLCGLAFVLVPTRGGYADDPVSGLFAPLFTLVFAVDGVHNFAPSLHVAGASLVLLASASRASARLRLFLLLWLALLCASTLFTHRHHLVDVASGFALALLVRRLFPIRLCGDANGPAESR